MDRQVGVFRTGEELAAALASVRSIKERARHAPVKDRAKIYNSNLFHAFELDNLVDAGRGDGDGRARARGVARGTRPA